MASSFTFKASNVATSSLDHSLSLWSLFHHLFLILWPSCLFLIRILLIALGLQDNPGKSLHLKNLHLTTFAMSFFSCEMIYSQISGIGTWTSLGDHYSIMFPECLGAVSSGPSMLSSRGQVFPYKLSWIKLSLWTPIIKNSTTVNIVE